MKEKIINKIISIALRFIVERTGKVEHQHFFRKLCNIAIEGMNYSVGTLENSGEQNAIKYVKNKLASQKEFVLFDGGANIGDYTKCLIEIFADADYCIYAFEPSETTFRQLKENLTAYSNIYFANKALGELDGFMTLYKDEEASGHASVYQRRLEHVNIAMDKHEKIGVVTIDNFCEVNKIQRIDFLKLDIEGHEFKALKGAEKMLSSKKIRFIQFEFGGCNIDSKIFLQDFFYLLGDNYELYRIVKDGIYPLGKYTERLELFSTVNYLAELK